jgi:hypothetical protein
VFEPFTVNVLPVVAGEEADVNDVNASASGSFAVTKKLRRAPSFTACVAGAVTVGGRSTLVTVTVVLAVPCSVFEAVKSTVYAP